MLRKIIRDVQQIRNSLGGGVILDVVMVKDSLSKEVVFEQNLKRGGE